MFGVDTGAIHLLTFRKPVTQLFENPFKSDGGVQKIFMQVKCVLIAKHSKYLKLFCYNDLILILNALQDKRNTFETQ